MADLEKLRKWQEERIARKLRGEYESAVLHLAEVVGDPVNLVDTIPTLIIFIGQ